MRIEVDLKNLNYKVITNEGAKCGFCNKNLKPIGFDYLYVNYDKNMIEYERCNCEKSVQFWKEVDKEQEEKQKRPWKKEIREDTERESGSSKTGKIRLSDCGSLQISSDQPSVLRRR